jgi:hypothetical protein
LRSHPRISIICPYEFIISIPQRSLDGYCHTTSYHWKKCAQLQLSNNEISEGLAILASELTNNTTMEELTLFNNRICDAAIISLVQSLIANTTLKILGLGVNNITNTGIDQ